MRTQHNLTVCTLLVYMSCRNQTLAWGGGGFLVLYLANGLLNQIDRLPILPQFLELVGFAFSSWFAFR